MTPASLRVPALTLTPPVPVPTTPRRCRPPVPVLVRLKVSPETSPPKVTAAVLPTDTDREPVSVIAPVFCVRLPVPVKLRSAASVTALVIVVPPEPVSRTPPLTVKRPAVEPEPPRAKKEEARTSVPASRFVAPE